MIQNLIERQNRSKNVYFAKRLTDALYLVGLEPSPKIIAIEFNRHYKTDLAQPHTVRKWLIGASIPRSELLILLANWLNVDPKYLLRGHSQNLGETKRINFDIEFNVKEVILNYLSLANKDKAIFRSIVDALSQDHRIFR